MTKTRSGSKQTGSSKQSGSKQSGAVDLDRLDLWVARRVADSCKNYPQASRAFKQLVDRGWSYTAALGVYLNAAADGSLGGDADGTFVEVSAEDPSHATLAVFVFGKAAGDGLLGLDPAGALFRNPGAGMYRMRRLNGRRSLWVHPAMAEYVARLGGADGEKQEGGGGGGVDGEKLHCVYGKGKEGSLVFSAHPTCIHEIVPKSMWFCSHSYAGSAHCGNLQWLRATHGKNTLFKVNKDESDTAEELVANNKVHDWLSRRHFLHFTPLTPRASHVIAMDRNNHVVGTMLVLNRMDGDVTKLKLSVNALANIAKTVLTVTHVLHENGHLHLDIKPKNVLYAVTRDHGNGAAEAEAEADNNREPDSDPDSLRFALADFGILEEMRRVHDDVVKGEYSGTYGYLSPLLLDYKDDYHNDVYRVFRKVAREGATRRSFNDDQLAELFQKEKKTLKDTSRMGKIDLHSLGLTLFDLLESNVPHLRHDDAGRLAMIAFIEALLFFEEDHFQNTFQALRALCRLFPVCSDVDVVTRKSRAN